MGQCYKWYEPLLDWTTIRDIAYMTVRKERWRSFIDHLTSKTAAAGRCSGIKIINKSPIIPGIPTISHISLYNFDGLTTAEDMLLNRGINLFQGFPAWTIMITPPTRVLIIFLSTLRFLKLQSLSGGFLYTSSPWFDTGIHGFGLPVELYQRTQHMHMGHGLVE